MNLLSKAVVVPLKASLLFLAACFFATTTVHATLIGFVPETPFIFFSKNINVPKSTTYNAGTQLFRLSATPDTLLTSTTSSSVTNSISTGQTRNILVNIQVDNSGTLVGGVSGHDLVLVGAVNDGTIIEDGVLLTAEISEFGFQEGGNTDSFDMTFTVTGGKLQNLYPDNTVGITYVAESSTFVNFANSFTGDAKGALTKISIAPVPKIAICTLVSIDGGVTYFDADNISGDSCDIYPQTIPSAPLGLDATYKYVVTNPGNETLTNVFINDPTLMILNVPVPLSCGDLIPGEMCMVDANTPGFEKLNFPDRCAGSLGLKTNLATANGTGVISNIDVSDDDPANVRCTAEPDIDIRKEVSVDGGPFLDANDVSSAAIASLTSSAEYRFIVTNTGNEDLVNVFINDPVLGLVGVPIGDLIVGDTVTITSGSNGFTALSVNDICPSTGTKVNIVEVKANGALTNDPVEASDPANVVCGDPKIQLLKKVSIDGVNFFDADNALDADVPVGLVNITNATYRIIVKNIGDEILTEVNIKDVTLGIDQLITDLAPGEERTINSGDSGFGALAVTNVCGNSKGNKNNIATVDSVGKDTGLPASDANPANVRCIDGPEIELLKQVSLTGGEPFFDADTELTAVVGVLGANATYRLIVRNIGDETLTNITLNDPTLNIVNVELVGLNLAPGDEVIVDAGNATYTIPALYKQNRCDSEGNKRNVALVEANGVFTGTPVDDDNEANVKCEQEPVCSLSIKQQCAIVDQPTSDDLLCQAAIVKTTLKYTGPSMTDATVVFEGDKNGSVTYTNVDLVQDVTILTSAGQNGYTIDATVGGGDGLGSKTRIYINGVEEIIHTSCSAVYYAGQPAPLDGNTPNPPNSDKGDPSPNWFVVDFEDKDGNYVTGGTGQPGTIGDNCSAISSSPVEVLHFYTVTNTGLTDVELTSIFDSELGEVLDVIPTVIPSLGQYSVQTSSLVTGTFTQTSIANANIVGNSAAMCGANDSVELSVEPPMVPVTCSDIKPLTSLSLIYNGPNGVDIVTEKGETFANVQNGNQITFILGDQNDSDIFLSDTLTGASIGTSRFHKSCSDSEMNGNEDCGMAQGDGKGNDASLLNTFLLDGMIGENGSFACNLTNTGVVPGVPGSGGGPTDAITAEAVLDLSDDKIKWKLFNNSNTDLFVTDITVKWPGQHDFIEKMKLEGDFAKGDALEAMSSPTTLGVSDFVDDMKKRKLKKDDDKWLEIEFKEKYKNNQASDYYISITFDNGQTLTIGNP